MLYNTKTSIPVDQLNHVHVDVYLLCHSCLFSFIALGELTHVPGNCCKLIAACCILHNICLGANLPMVDDIADEEPEDEKDQKVGDCANTEGNLEG